MKTRTLEKRKGAAPEIPNHFSLAQKFTYFFGQSTP